MTDKNLLRTPLNEWHRTNGGKMIDFGGWEMPVQYEAGILQEHLATRRYAGLFDVSHMGRAWIKGEKRIEFLQHVLSNDIAAIAPWTAQYNLIPDEQGGVIDDAYMFRFGENDYLLVVNASNREKDLAHLNEQVKAFDGVTIEDVTFDMAMLATQGPISREILGDMVEEGLLSDPKHNNLAKVRIMGADVFTGSTGYTGEPIGLELFLPADKAVDIIDGVYARGKDKGALPVGLGARDTLRLEAGMPLYGHEFGKDPEGKPIPAFAFPLSTFAVNFADWKGDFIGRKALKAQFDVVKQIRAGEYKESDVLPRRFKQLSLIDRGIARNGDEVFVNDKKAGFVTSGTTVPYWKFEGEGESARITEETGRRAIATALLDTEIKIGSEVTIKVRNNSIRARIVRKHGQPEGSFFKTILP